MKKILINLSLIVFILLLNGCSQKPTQIEFLKEEKYPFQVLNLKGVYFDTTEEQKNCISKMEELDSFHFEIRKFYENQILEYLGDEK